MARSYYKTLRRSRIAGHYEDPLSTKLSVSRETEPRSGAATPGLYIDRYDRAGNKVAEGYFDRNRPSQKGY